MELDPDHVAAVEAKIRAHGGYDLEEEDLGPFDVAGWEGLPVRLYRYAKKDRDGTRKEGLAAMLNPSPHQTARWIVSATCHVKGMFSPGFADELLRVIRMASGFQFLVRGVHWEDMNGSSVHVAYPFFDGVAVKLRALPEGYPHRALKPEALRAVLDATEADVTHVGKYARIASTTREDYENAGGRLDVAGALWFEAIRENMRLAWGQDSNFLIYAKAASL